MRPTFGSVLITGGSGYFGRAFSEHMLVDGWADRVVIYSRCEHRQAAAREMLGDDPRMRWMIGDVRDYRRLVRAMRGVDVVVHAAALKRIEVGAYNPDEMVRTNVLGTLNVCDAAIACGVRHVVGVSSDKAFQPISPYGQSKALAESLLLGAHGGAGGPTFTVVRYGNVAGSTGSVIPRWRAMIAGGATNVPVTDPECTRFWMTARQAVEFVSDSIGGAHCGKVRVPELPAFRLADLAEAMGVDMDIIGLPPHEKRHEGMRDGVWSHEARRMSVAEIREGLENV